MSALFYRVLVRKTHYLVAKDAKGIQLLLTYVRFMSAENHWKSNC